MAGSTDQRITALLEASLAEGARDVMQLRDAVAAKAAGWIAGREGALHALLHRLVRRGQVVPGAPGERGLVRYTRADGMASPAAPAPPTAPATPVDRAAPDAVPSDSTARRVATGARRPEDRARIAADVRAHLRALEKAGHPEAFGSPRTARHLLRRVDRRLPTVAFAAGAGDQCLRFALHEGPWILGAILLFLVLRAWIAEVFYIPSASMEPTLLEGDRVVVLKPGGQDMPDRWQIVTFKRRGTTYVKRVAGLGGETIHLAGGDVFIDGTVEVKPDDVREALRFPYASWELGIPDDEWTWSRTGSNAPPGADPPTTTQAYTGPPLWGGGPSGAGPMGRDVPLRDVYATLEAERQEGAEVVLELEWEPDELVAEPPVVLALRAADDGVHLAFHSSDGSDLTWAVGPAPAPGPLSLRLVQVDGIVWASAGGHAWAPRPVGEHLPRPGGHLGIRVRTVGEGAAARRLILEKDVHYTLAGHLAVPVVGSDAPEGADRFQIPPDALFMLGDNTYDSRDSRFTSMGAVRRAELIGPVRFRIWPPGRIGGVR